MNKELKKEEGNIQKKYKDKEIEKRISEIIENIIQFINNCCRKGYTFDDPVVKDIKSEKINDVVKKTLRNIFTYSKGNMKELFQILFDFYSFDYRFQEDYLINSRTSKKLECFKCKRAGIINISHQQRNYFLKPFENKNLDSNFFQNKTKKCWKDVQNLKCKFCLNEKGNKTREKVQYLEKNPFRGFFLLKERDDTKIIDKFDIYYKRRNEKRLLKDHRNQYDLSFVIDDDFNSRIENGSNIPALKKALNNNEAILFYQKNNILSDKDYLKKMKENLKNHEKINHKVSVAHVYDYLQKKADPKVIEKEQKKTLNQIYGDKENRGLKRNNEHFDKNKSEYDIKSEQKRKKRRTNNYFPASATINDNVDTKLITDIISSTPVTNSIPFKIKNIPKGIVIGKYNKKGTNSKKRIKNKK